VEKPATQTDVLLFSDETIELAVDEEKHVVTGVVLVPDRKYYRNNEFFKRVFNEDSDGEIYFSKQTVADYSKDYINNSGNAFNVDHSVDVNKDDMQLFESWIINTANDKAYDLKFDKEKVRNGSWMMSQFINTETPTGLQLWKDFHSGKYKGLSIQGSPSIRLVKDIKMSVEDSDEKVANDIVDLIVEIVKNK
jgi:hypothetical protein